MGSNFLSDFFESLQATMNTGGSYNLEIDYDSLAFPGPEVYQMAMTPQDSNNNKSNTSAYSFSHSASRPELELATLAGGCFWGLQLALQRLEGVEYTLAGYTQGLSTETKPNYEQVVAGNTCHCEAVLVYFDPSKLTYEELLQRGFLDRVNVVTTVNGGLGKDVGTQYRTGIYVHTAQQEEMARKLLLSTAAAATTSNRKLPVATELKVAQAFWPAEEYHQRYLEKGGRFGSPQSAEKGSTDAIRCYG